MTSLQETMPSPGGPSAHVFPGQGSQRPGMGAEVFSRYPAAVEMAADVLGYPLHRVCLDGSAEDLGVTDVTQPALYLVSCLSSDAWRDDHGDDGGVLAGHSLGEFAAVYAAGGYGLEQGLRVVQERGRLMAGADNGTMAAVVRAPVGDVVHLVGELGIDGLQVANLNAPQQCVLSGPEAALADPALAAGVQGLRGRLVPLKVGGAFHSSLMQDAQRSFAEFLTDVPFAPLDRTVLSNVTAAPMPTTGYVELLAAQMTATVRWSDICMRLVGDGVRHDRVVEHGPGATLRKLFSQHVAA